MASVRGQGAPEPIERAVKVLLKRHMAADLLLLLAILVAFLAPILFLPGGLLGVAGLLILVYVFVVVAVLPLAGRTRASRYGKIPALTNGLAGLADCSVRGLDLVSKVHAPDPTVPPLTMTISGDAADVRLDVPWDVPADVLANGRYCYSDLPGLWEELEAVRTGLTGFEFVRTDLIKGLLKSLVRPVWNQPPQSDESAEAVRDRILDRWRHMESMRRRAALERVFEPRLVRGDKPLVQQAELFTGWCSKCWTARLMRSGNNPDCPKCHTRLWLIWCSRGTEGGIPWKMDQVRDRYKVQ